MPIHFLERYGAKEGFRALRELNCSDLTHSALHLNLNNTKDPVIMLTSISSINPDFTKLFKFQSFNNISGKRQLSGTRIHKGVAFNILPTLILGKKAILPITQPDRGVKNTHKGSFSGFCQ